MLYLSCFSPNTVLFQQASVFTIPSPQSSKITTTAKAPKHYRTAPTHFHGFLCGNSSSFCPYPITSTTSSKEVSHADWSNAVPPNQFSKLHLLAIWLQSCHRAEDVKMVHAVIFKFLRNSVTYLNNNLICGYMRLGELVNAQKVFNGMSDRNVVSWTAMINGYLNFGMDDVALSLFCDSIENGIIANGKTFVCVLNLCSRRLDFELGRQIHACIVKSDWRETNSCLIVDTAIVYFYAHCGELTSAFCAFDRMVEHDVVCWTAMITTCRQQGLQEKAFDMFLRMLHEGFSPNEFTSCAILKTCGEDGALKFGRQIHGAIVKNMYENDVFVGSSLVDMYAKCGEMSDSRKVFDGMRWRNVVTWTSIIAGYARNGLGEEAISLFRAMKRRKVISNNMTVVSVLMACGSIRELHIGREVHAQIVKNCIHSNEYIESTLVWFYCKCGESNIALKVLQQMPLRDVVSWTAIVSGYACLGHEFEALEFFKKMVEEGVEPNAFTCSSALKVCASLEAVLQGKLIHSFANKTPALSNVFVGSALIHMYAKCGHISEAIRVFDSMPERNSVSWNTMILGYAKNGLWQEALKLLRQMKAGGIEVGDNVFATVVAACGS